MSTIRTAKKMQLGLEINWMMERAGVSPSEAREMIEATRSRMSDILNGAGAISPGDLVLLANKLGFTDPDYHEMLQELRRDNHKRGRSTGPHRAYRADVRLLVDLEANADQIRCSEVEVIPGLLQCESYVRAMHAGTPAREGLTIDDRVSARLARQEILDRENPPELSVMMSESCLRRTWGSDSEVMREQLEHVIGFSRSPKIKVQVLPFAAKPGRQSSVGHHFVRLRLPSPGRAAPLKLIATEGIQIDYVDTEAAIAAHDDAWDRLTASALSFDESRDFIAQIARESSKKRR